MLFNVIFSSTQTIALMCLSLIFTVLSWWTIVSHVEYYNEKAFRKSAYKRKKWFAKLFLKGLEHLTTIFDRIMNFIEKLLHLIFFLFSILNLIICLPFFSDIMIITGAAQWVIAMIIGLENDGFSFLGGKKKG